MNVLKVLVLLCLPFFPQAQFLSITPRGVFATDITVYPLFGDSALRPIAQVAQVRAGQTALMELNSSLLPGEFAIRYDYRSAEGASPYPSEQYLLVGRSGLSISLNPMYANQPDSVVYGMDGGENARWRLFLAEDAKQRAAPERMRQWLLQEPPSRDAYYRSALREFERRRERYNAWLEGERQAYAELLVSRLMTFSRMPALSKDGHHTGASASGPLALLDLQDTLILHARAFTQTLDAHVQNGLNLFGKPGNTDSLILALTSQLLDDASKGHPRVYGAVVDHLYQQFLRSGIDAGMEQLAVHVARPSCQSRNREAITRKLAVMGKIRVGLPAIDVEIPLAGGPVARLSQLTAGRPRSLLLFWSAGCSHCLQLVDALSRQLPKAAGADELQVIAVSIDRGEVDRGKWSGMIASLPQWRHAICADGPSSETARAYGVLATPTMFLIDGTTFRIQGIPSTMDDLLRLIHP